MAMNSTLVEKVQSSVDWADIEGLDENGWRKNSLFDYQVIRGFVVTRFVDDGGSSVYYVVANDLDAALDGMLEELRR